MENKKNPNKPNNRKTDNITFPLFFNGFSNFDNRFQCN